MRGASNLLKLLLPCLLLLLSNGASAQGPHYKIAEVQDMVDGMLDQFKQYTTFQGADKAPLSIDPHAESATSPNASTVIQKRATTPYCAPYWLENIKHQGKAAFNSNSSYVVFRNVKSYGAKGMENPFDGCSTGYWRLTDSMFEKVMALRTTLPPSTAP